MILLSWVPRTAALVAFAALALAACQTTPGATANADTASLEARTRSFAQDTAIAAFYAQRCAGQGIGMAGGTPEAAAEVFSARLTDAGYDRAQIEAATAAVDTAAAGQASVAYLQERGLGADDGDATLCASARAEQAQDTAVGQMLTSR